MIASAIVPIPTPLFFHPLLPSSSPLSLPLPLPSPSPSLFLFSLSCLFLILFAAIPLSIVIVISSFSHHTTPFCFSFCLAFLFLRRAPVSPLLPGPPPRASSHSAPHRFASPRFFSQAREQQQAVRVVCDATRERGTIRQKKRRKRGRRERKGGEEKGWDDGKEMKVCVSVFRPRSSWARQSPCSWAWGRACDGAP